MPSANYEHLDADMQRFIERLSVQCDNPPSRVNRQFRQAWNDECCTNIRNTAMANFKTFAGTLLAQHSSPVSGIFGVFRGVSRVEPWHMQGEAVIQNKRNRKAETHEMSFLTMILAMKASGKWKLAMDETFPYSRRLVFSKQSLKKARTYNFVSVDLAWRRNTPWPNRLKDFLTADVLLPYCIPTESERVEFYLDMCKTEILNVMPRLFEFYQFPMFEIRKHVRNYLTEWRNAWSSAMRAF